MVRADRLWAARVAPTNLVTTQQPTRRFSHPSGANDGVSSVNGDSTTFYATAAQVIPLFLLAGLIELRSRRDTTPAWEQTADFFLTVVLLAIIGAGELVALRAAESGEASELERAIVITALLGSGSIVATAILIRQAAGRVGRALTALLLAASVCVIVWQLVVQLD